MNEYWSTDKTIFHEWALREIAWLRIVITEGPRTCDICGKGIKSKTKACVINDKAICPDCSKLPLEALAVAKKFQE